MEQRGSTPCHGVCEACTGSRQTSLQDNRCRKPEYTGHANVHGMGRLLEWAEIIRLPINVPMYQRLLLDANEMKETLMHRQAIAIASVLSSSFAVANAAFISQLPLSHSKTVPIACEFIHIPTLRTASANRPRGNGPCACRRAP